MFALLCRLPYLLSIFTSISKATKKQPHLIFILADDLVSNFCRGKQFSQHFAFLKLWDEKGKKYMKFIFFCRVLLFIYHFFIIVYSPIHRDGMTLVFMVPAKFQLQISTPWQLRALY